MIVIQYIAAPLLGGVIGYITNDIAIRMLFRPHTAKYFLGVKVPFTPGIIPKEKGRIAEAIGGVIANNLMNQEVLEKYLLSAEMIQKVRSSVQHFIDTQKTNDETVRQFLAHYLSDEEISSIASEVNNNIIQQLHDKLSDETIGSQVAHAAMDYVANKLNNNGAQELLAGLGGILGGFGGAAKILFGGNVIGKFLEMLKEPAEQFLAKNINKMLLENGDAIVSNIMGNETKKFLNKPFMELLKDKDEQLAKAVDAVESIYRTIINDHLPKILENVDISKIVRDRINEMDVNETEKLIFQVMDKELKAIVWLGALLGLLMGSINIFI